MSNWQCDNEQPNHGEHRVHRGPWGVWTCDGRPEPVEQSTGAGNDLRQVDDLAQRLTAMGDVLREAINVVAVGYDPTGKWYHVNRGAFLALADAVERAQPGAVEATRKALGK